MASVLTTGKVDSVFEAAGMDEGSGSWAVKEVKVVEFEVVELEAEEDVDEFEVERERLEFFRVPPPTGTLRSAPPWVQ